jgi:hypothetical protein
MPTNGDPLQHLTFNSLGYQTNPHTVTSVEAFNKESMLDQDSMNIEYPRVQAFTSSEHAHGDEDEIGNHITRL